MILVAYQKNKNKNKNKNVKKKGRKKGRGEDMKFRDEICWGV